MIPKVPVRQWVLTLPWARRLVLARRNDLLRGVLSQALDVIFAWCRYQAAERLGLPAERARGFRWAESAWRNSPMAPSCSG
ncbi:MAG TPA: hypothetical protein QGF58_09340 [Myxococcota bacterium]|nr:hypothetical protein [Myxococcota bacterium]